MWRSVGSGVREYRVCRTTFAVIPSMQRADLLTLRNFSAILSPPSTAIIYDQHGPPGAVTRLVEMPSKELKETDVCVRMLASPINPSDINRIEGTYPQKPCLPAVGGYEGVGEVHSVGSAVKILAPGDRVIPFPPSFGTWQTYIVQEQRNWHKISKDPPLEYAATVSVNPFTALRLLEDFTPLNAGDFVIQNGATSIVGQCIIQLANIRGIHSINLIRDRAGALESVEMLKELGADEVLIESQLEGKSLKDLLIDTADPVLGFNCVGGNAASLVLKLLRQGATMVTYGGMSKKPISVATSSFIFKDLHLRGFWLQKWLKSEKAKNSRNTIDYLLALVQQGVLKYKTELVPFENFHFALNKALGKFGSSPKQVLRFPD